METMKTSIFLLTLLLYFLICKSSEVAKNDPPYLTCPWGCRRTRMTSQQQQECYQHCKQLYRNPQGGQEENNPYFFDEENFSEIMRTEEGNARMLQRFSYKSDLHRGIDNYRLTLLEANPSTFILPVHFDAEAVCYVIQGKGSYSLFQQEMRKSYNIERGDVIRIPAGTTIYWINIDCGKKLQIAQLFQSVSTPGQYQAYHGVGGQQQSYLTAFSNEILEAAFNTSRELIERLFKGNREGVIVRASQDQIKVLSRDSKEGGQSHSTRGPYKMLKTPRYRSKFGQQFRVTPTHYKQLQDLDLTVSFTNITQGAMTAPFYNSVETAIILVVEGRGWLEMACANLSSQSQTRSGGVHYQRVSSQLLPQTVFVIPAGHPAVIVASDNENLKIVTFGINGGNNKRDYLAGKNNILNRLEKEAKELSFNMDARVVDSIINNQQNVFFLPGPNYQCQ